jgi:hypothetical protein
MSGIAWGRGRARTMTALLVGLLLFALGSRATSDVGRVRAGSQSPGHSFGALRVAAGDPRGGDGRDRLRRHDPEHGARSVGTPDAPRIERERAGPA